LIVSIRNGSEKGVFSTIREAGRRHVAHCEHARPLLPHDEVAERRQRQRPGAARVNDGRAATPQAVLREKKKTSLLV
jgi:hypothetical protein